MGSNEHIGLEKGDRWLLNLPLYHVGGLAILFRCFLSGATVVLPDEMNPYSVQDLSKSAISHISLVPTQLFRILGETVQTSVSPFALKCALIGGAPLSVQLLRRALELGWPIASTYGLTEMSSQVTTTKPGNFAFHSGTLLKHRELKVDSSGEILVKGPTLFSGYWNSGHHLDLPLDPNGWFRTGDLGSLQKDGGLDIRGRLDHLFISGGENIQPEEIENALSHVLGVRQSVVVPVSDPEYGARPVAFVRCSEWLDHSAALWSEQLAQTLPRFKIPIRYLNWPEGPETQGLKPNRRALSVLAEKHFSQESSQVIF